MRIYNGKNISLAIVILFMSMLQLIVLSGCATKQEQQVCVPTIQIQKQDVPVPCHMPKVECNFADRNKTINGLLLECIVNQKRAMAVCDADSYDTNNTDNNISY